MKKIGWGSYGGSERQRFYWQIGPSFWTWRGGATEVHLLPDDQTAEQPRISFKSAVTRPAPTIIRSLLHHLSAAISTLSEFTAVAYGRIILELRNILLAMRHAIEEHAKRQIHMRHKLVKMAMELAVKIGRLTRLTGL